MVPLKFLAQGVLDLVSYTINNFRNQAYYKPAPNLPTFVEFLNGIKREPVPDDVNENTKRSNAKLDNTVKSKSVNVNLDKKLNV